LAGARELRKVEGTRSDQIVELKSERGENKLRFQGIGGEKDLTKDTPYTKYLDTRIDGGGIDE